MSYPNHTLKQKQTAVAHLDKAAQRCEDLRDTHPEFSAEYWAAHDCAQRLYEAAESLVNCKPRGWHEEIPL